MDEMLNTNEVTQSKDKDVVKTVLFVVEEFILFVLNCLIEVWHFIAGFLFALFHSLIVFIIASIFIIMPTYKGYANFVENTVEKNNITTYRLYNDSEMFLPDAKNLQTSTETYILSKDIPQMLQSMIVEYLDTTFYENKGIDNDNIILTLRTMIKTQGGQYYPTYTITERVVDTVYLQEEAGIDRFFERYMGAKRLTEKFSKDEILEFYCNDTNYGNNQIGIARAAQYYFKKSVNELSIAELAYLTVVGSSYKDYNPLKDSKATIEESQNLLQTLRYKSIITEVEYNDAIKEVVKIAIK